MILRCVQCIIRFRPSEDKTDDGTRIWEAVTVYNGHALCRFHLKNELDGIGWVDAAINALFEEERELDKARGAIVQKLDQFAFKARSAMAQEINSRKG